MSDTRIWMYHKEHEARIFNSPEDVPRGEGWADSPESAEGLSVPKEVARGDVEVGEPEKIEETPEEDVIEPKVVKPKRKYRRKKR